MMVRRAATVAGIALMIAIGHQVEVSTQASSSTGVLLIVSMDEVEGRYRRRGHVADAGELEHR